MRVSTRLPVTVIMLLAWYGPGAATEIYRWVDADGVVHYSDAAPRGDVTATTIDVEESRTPDYDPLEDPYSILNQARRLREARSALVEARLEREQASRPPVSPEPAPAPSAYWRTPDYRSWWYSPALPGRPGSRPGEAFRQYDAMQQLDLTGPRPQSVNSGVHQQRVERSTALPITPPSRPQRPRTPRN
ncbi:MAG: DUF4124 domain-containing protein [Gammaproteobacteria bacterium]|jgi:hypothetical protein